MDSRLGHFRCYDYLAGCVGYYASCWNFEEKAQVVLADDGVYRKLIRFNSISILNFRLLKRLSSRLLAQFGLV